ncbi:B3 DNA binding domain containing protein [Parasponia andersonii]|uniref:B3 DNA binding domain containing protein n=1 Tax=Parasponia andersonii TaxID=3476 RepID=A0A2P5BZ32_PARAD|nr:B3 DNA binding domain containing protein [Parasponia andersonii]
MHYCVFDIVLVMLKFNFRNPLYKPFKSVFFSSQRVPKYFVKKCGETLSDSVFVKLPCGSEWKMKLTENDDKFWLETGWPEFVEHYSIRRGNLLTFRYEGNSELHVVVFDINTVEIDYPSGPIHFDEKFRAPKREVIDADFADILDDFSPCPKTRVESSLPCSPPPKRMKIYPTCKAQSNLSHTTGTVSDHSETVVENRMSRGSSKNWKLDSLSESYGDKSRQKKSKILERMKPLRRQEKYAALRKASGFKSKRPFCKILMQPSYVHGTYLSFSSNFATRYIKKTSCNVILKALDGRTWTVKYIFGVYDRLRTARFISGWKEFSQDNNLEVGDVFAFVLLEGIKITFHVLMRVEPEQNPTNETKSGRTVNGENSIPISHKNLSTKQANGCIATPLKTRRRHLNGIEKARILERAPFESENPFFKFVIQSSYACNGASLRVPIPLDFAERYLKNEGDVVLSVPNGRSWFCQFKFRSLRTGKQEAEIYGGWKDFAVDNNLEVGDVCIFELLDGTEISFQVSIVRVADDAHRQSSRATKSAQGATKPKQDVKIEIDGD